MATHLAVIFQKCGHTIHQIVSKNYANAEKLAKKVNAKAVQSIGELDKVDLIVIAVNDDVIAEVSSQIKTDGMVIHTSGTSSIDVLSNCSSNTGVFWPIKSVVQTEKPDFVNVPICFEGSNSKTTSAIKELAEEISECVYQMNGEQRKQAHLAAVFTNNFTNYMYTIAEDILKANGQDFSILTTLIENATRQLRSVSPNKSQTGPAYRNDQKVINEHLELLADKPEYQDLYKFVSESIIKKYNG